MARTAKKTSANSLFSAGCLRGASAAEKPLQPLLDLPAWAIGSPSFSYTANITHQEHFPSEFLFTQPTKGKKLACALPPCILLNTQTKIISPKSTAHCDPSAPVWEQTLFSNTRNSASVGLPRRCKHLPQTSAPHIASPEAGGRCWRRNGNSGAQLEACPDTHTTQGSVQRYRCAAQGRDVQNSGGKHAKHQLFSCWAKRTWKVGGIEACGVLQLLLYQDKPSCQLPNFSSL